MKIGNGYGSLAPTLTASQNCSFDGVEIDPDTEPSLKEIYRRYWIGDIERLSIDQMKQDDRILLPDVLENTWG